MNRLLFAIPLLAGAWALSSVPASAWGGDGHRTVGAIADMLLDQQDPAVRDRVKHILDNHSLEEVSVWADCAKGFRYCQRSPSRDEQAFADANPRHHSFHYTDVPIQQPQYRAGTAGTGSDDVVQIIRHAVNVLRGRTPNQGPAVLTERQALWLLVHLVGDIHQPLHVGAVYFDKECDDEVDPNVAGAGQPEFGIGKSIASTTGGNDLKISSRQSMHSLWDSGTVTGAMRLANVRTRSVDDFAAAIVANPPRAWETQGDTTTWAEQWATEIMPLASNAINRLEIGEADHADHEETGPKCTWPVTVPRNYGAWANQQALTQLGKAGFRLAALLRAALGGP